MLSLLIVVKGKSNTSSTKKSKQKCLVKNFKGNILLHSDKRKQGKQKGNLQFSERFWKLLGKK